MAEHVTLPTTRRVVTAQLAGRESSVKEGNSSAYLHHAIMEESAEMQTMADDTPARATQVNAPLNVSHLKKS